jgi:hypothetical protein
MSRPASSTPKTASRPALKNPLRSSTMPLITLQASEDPGSAGPGAERPAPEITAAGLRQMQISEFCAWLRTQTNKHKRPFQEETLRGYAETARALSLWMAADDIETGHETSRTDRPYCWRPSRSALLAATKKTPWASQSVTGFASRRTATLPRTPITVG